MPSSQLSARPHVVKPSSTVHSSDAFICVRRTPGGLVHTGAAEYTGGHELSDLCDGIPQGVYGHWRFDGTTLTARVDPLGLFPLFYGAGPDFIALSPSLTTLARVIPEVALDTKALSVFLTLGFYLDNDTPLKNVYAVPPRGVLTWDGALRVDGGPWCAEPNDMDRPRATQGFVNLVRVAVERRRPGSRPWGIALSGGRDSRYLLFQLAELGDIPRACISTRQYPPRSNNDADYAARVAQCVGAPHRVIDPLPRFEAEFRKNIETHFLADEHAWFLGVADTLRSSVEVVYDGIGGDTLTGLWLPKEWRPALESEQFDEAADIMVGRGLGEPVGLAGVPLLDRDAIVHEVSSAMRAHRGLNPATQFMFWNRMRREIGLMPAALLAPLTAMCPYLDTDLYTFLSGVAPDVTGFNALHDDAFALAFPQHQNVPVAPYGRKRPAALHYAAFALRTLRYCLSESVSGATTAKDYAVRLMQARRSGRKEVRRELSPARVLYNLQLRLLVEQPAKFAAAAASVS